MSIIIDYQNDEEFACLVSDCHLLYNLVEQKKRGTYLGSDFIRPGLLSGQSLESVLRETIKSITNHLDNLEKKDVVLI